MYVWLGVVICLMNGLVWCENIEVGIKGEDVGEYWENIFWVKDIELELINLYVIGCYIVLCVVMVYVVVRRGCICVFLNVNIEYVGEEMII